MKGHPSTMPIFRLAYLGLFLVALIAVFTLWAQVGGQGHLDLVPWPVKLVLGVGSAYAIMRAGAAAVAGDHGWNSQTVKWTGVALAALLLCGLASSYTHNNLEDSGEGSDEEQTTISLTMDGVRGRWS